MVKPKELTIEYCLENEMWDFINKTKEGWQLKTDPGSKSFKPQKKVSPTAKVDYTGEDYEFRQEKWIMKSKAYQQAFKGPWLVYTCLWSNIIRAPMRTDTYDIYADYYCRGQLACALTIEQISEQTSMPYNNVRRAIKHLIECGIIQRHTKILPKKKNFKKSIYIMGFITKTDKEIMFIEDLARRSGAQ